MPTESPRRALVTGAAGFIGSHLTGELVRLGWQVRALQRDHAHPDLGALGWLAPELRGEVEVVSGDLRDAESVARAARNCELLLHLGAQISIPYSYLNPRAFFETNVIGSLNVARAAQECGAERLVHVSTSEVYGTAQQRPMTEDHPLRPQSPYAASKVGADALMTSYHRSFDLPVTILRPFNTYGPHQSARAVIPTIISQALWSERVRLGSLDTRRDFTYVSDTVAGMIAAALEPAALGKTVHIGSGESVSIAEVAALVGQVLDKELELDVEAHRIRPPESEVQELLCDASRAHELIGWYPQVGLIDGLSRTARWMLERPELWRVSEYAI